MTITQKRNKPLVDVLQEFLFSQIVSLQQLQNNSTAVTLQLQL